MQSPDAQTRPAEHGQRRPRRRIRQMTTVLMARSDQQPRTSRRRPRPGTHALALVVLVTTAVTALVGVAAAEDANSRHNSSSDNHELPSPSQQQQQQSDHDAQVSWMVASTVLLGVSAIATLLTTLHLRCRWDVTVSSVRWLFWLFFLYLFLWTTLRVIYLIWLTVLPHQRDDDVDDTINSWVAERLDRVGIQSIANVRGGVKPWILTVYCLGDVALFGVALITPFLAHELFHLARMSMDRGVDMERRRIRWYNYGLHASMAVFGVVELALAVAFDGYSVHLRRCLLSIYIIQFAGLAFMVGQLCVLRLKGRNYETVHGTFVTSPAYARLKRIMFVYAIFSFQFQLSYFVLYVGDDPSKHKGLLESISISRVIYNFAGLALAVTTSCSQSCVLAACRCLMPEEFEAQYLHTRFAYGSATAPNEEDLEAPTTNPVFVFTDIQSSTALWAIDDGTMMDRATEIHDNIIRSTLPEHRGYEITTVGDAFQLAFRSIRDAVNFCMDVQLQLLVADWPKEIHGAVPATKKERVGRRVVFNGLRVRMGIHDSADFEGPLVQDTHVVTGKMTYTGVSAVLAEFVGDLGSGGQILVSGRVARWLKYRNDDVTLDFELDRIGQYTVPQVNMEVEIFQVTPLMLAGRRTFFTVPDKGRTKVHHPPRPAFRRLLQSPKVTTDYISMEVQASPARECHGA